MTYQYSRKNHQLFWNGKKLQLIDSEMNEIGACVKCKSPLESVSSYKFEFDSESSAVSDAPAYAVVSKCVSCFSFYADIYDLNWSWIDETEPVLIEDAGPADETAAGNISGTSVTQIPPEYESTTKTVNPMTATESEYSEKEDVTINNNPVTGSPSSKSGPKKTRSRKYKIPVYSDIVSSADDLNQIPMIQLKSVFSEAEVEAMFAKANGEKPIRQYFHRAKKKYPVFEEIFGIKIDIN
ncbi:hypothetical protein MsAg5_09840 [Methanosarcinaceae archaeon Ag5]|uniref:Uncharacterized protein n=1 Tax=Methanolapillus africanus TaxID=3028297 RepID=A0AAE4MJR6_9EURY|nr:hypothetical protein [Methanosarcinaceae archaeon Ag5]